MRYRCPRCGAIMVCMSTASTPPIISYQCYVCGYLSKPVRETELIEILPEHLWQAQFSELVKGEPMGKLIYVDRLKKDILALQDCYNGFSDTYDKACIIGVIEEQPTIEERKTGKWVDDPSSAHYKCSHCGFYAPYSLLYCEWLSDFCPNCGADMRGGNHETD